MNQVPQLYRVSDKKSLDEDELDYAINLLIEAEKIKENSELVKNISVEAKKKAKIYRSIDSIRDTFNEMMMNPGKTRAEDDTGPDPMKSPRSLADLKKAAKKAR